MLKYKAVTFDCAQTLVKVDWKPAITAVESALACGIELDETGAASAYDQLLRRRWSEFKLLNLSRDPKQTDEFWHRLTTDWLVEVGQQSSLADSVVEAANRSLFTVPSSTFEIYEDVIDCLRELRELGLRMAVISNWDISLHKTLRMFGIDEYFETTLASMEEGIEKPDPRIFEICLSRMALEPGDVLHVGDNPIDDYRGAKSAGMKGLVIDRQETTSSEIYISSLSELRARLLQ